MLASEKFAKIVDVLRQKTKSDQLVRAVRPCCDRKPAAGCSAGVPCAVTQETQAR